MGLLFLVAAVVFALSDGDGNGNGNGGNGKPNLRTFVWGRWVIELWGGLGAWSWSGRIDDGPEVISGWDWPDALTAEIAAKQAAYDWEETNEG